MAEAPMLSIVIPTFNRVAFLRRAIDSALAQTVPCEVVVVDHGSSDGTPELVASYGRSVLYVRRDHDDGPCIAWFDGVLRSSGTYIHLTFDDDWIAPEFAANTLPLMNDETAVVFTNVKVVSATDEFTLFDNVAFKQGQHPSSQLTNFLMQSRQTISPGCAIFRRQDALDALMINPVFASAPMRGVGPDLMMFLLPLSRRATYAFVDEFLAFFRSHSDSITVDALSDPIKERKLCDAYSNYKLAFLVQQVTSTFSGTDSTKAAAFVWRNVPRISAIRKSWFGRFIGQS